MGGSWFAGTWEGGYVWGGGGGYGVYVVGWRVTWRDTMGAGVRGGVVRGVGYVGEGDRGGYGGMEDVRGRVYVRNGGTWRGWGLHRGWGRLRGGVWGTLMG